MKFSDWWEQNKVIYETQGVSRDVAYTIWCAAVDNMGSLLITEELNRHS